MEHLNNLEIEAGPVTLRELTFKDRDDLLRIVRDYSEAATVSLYRKYADAREVYLQKMRNSGLDYLISLFRQMDTAYSNDIRRLQAVKDFSGLKKIEAEMRDGLRTCCPDCGLFSPYGPIKAPFDQSVARYLENAIAQNDKKPRNTFIMGIEIKTADKRRLIGCLVFDTIKQEIQGRMTIGDIGVFAETNARTTYWQFAAAGMLRFADKNLGLQDKNSLFISATTHPCNTGTGFLNEKRGWEKIQPVVTEYGLREQFVIPYHTLIDPVNNLIEKGIAVSAKRSLPPGGTQQ
jgi:hypothetical protein